MGEEMTGYVWITDPSPEFPKSLILIAVAESSAQAVDNLIPKFAGPGIYDDATLTKMRQGLASTEPRILGLSDNAGVMIIDTQITLQILR